MKRPTDFLLPAGFEEFANYTSEEFFDQKLKLKTDSMKCTQCLIRRGLLFPKNIQADDLLKAYSNDLNRLIKDVNANKEVSDVLVRNCMKFHTMIWREIISGNIEISQELKSGRVPFCWDNVLCEVKYA